MVSVPDSLEEPLDTTQIHPIPLVKIGFRLTGDDRGQMIDYIGSIRGERFSNRGVRYSPERVLTENGAPAGGSGVIVSAIVNRSTELPPMVLCFASASQNLRPTIPAAPVTRTFIPER